MRRVLVAVVCAVLVSAGAPAARATAPHLLVFSGTLGYRHGGIARMNATIAHLAELTKAFTVEFSEDPAVFDAALYDRVDGVIFNQVTSFGTVKWSQQQKDAFLRFFACGGAFVGVHATSDSSANGSWNGYKELVGAQFAAHPHFGSVYSYWATGDTNDEIAPHAQERTLTDLTFLVEDSEHPSMRPWSRTERFRMNDEIYRYTDDPRQVPGLHVLLSIDEQSDYWPQPLVGVVPNPRPIAGRSVTWAGYPDRMPVAWTKPYDLGRVFYTNLGHNPETWDRPDFQDHLLGGLGWATQTRPDRACVAA